MAEGKTTLRNIRYYRDADGVYLHADDLSVAIRSAAANALRGKAQSAALVVADEIDRLRRKAQGGAA